VAASVDDEVFLAHRFGPVETECDWPILRSLENLRWYMKTDMYLTINFQEND
jgi:hypothetical protein